MYAIVDIAGQQFKVEKDKKVFINRIKGEVGSKVDLDKVLFIDNEKEIKIGSPYLKDANVTGKIISHIKDKKVKIFKKKRRKGYKVLNSHRQYLTELLIEDISEKKAAKAVTKEKEPVEKADSTKPASKTASDKKDIEKKTPAKAASTVKPTTAKKAAAKQPVTKPGSPVKKKAVKKASVSKSTGDKKPAAKGKSQVSKTSKDKEQKKTK